MRNENLTAAKKAKAAGLKSLKWLAETAGVHPQQLDRWSKSRPKLFDLIIFGALFSNADAETCISVVAKNHSKLRAKMDEK